LPDYEEPKAQIVGEQDLFRGKVHEQDAHIRSESRRPRRIDLCCQHQALVEVGNPNLFPESAVELDRNVRRASSTRSD
jgi:hypothetical protein